MNERNKWAAEVEEISEAISEARQIIRAGLEEYRQEKMKRVKRKSEKEIFQELSFYGSLAEIYAASTHGYISEYTLHELVGLWDRRERERSEERYRDRVTDILETALWACGSGLFSRLRELECLQEENEED